MPDQLQLRGGTTTEHNSFTGALREVTVDTTKKTLVVHDGSQAGGTPLMKESGTVDPTSITIGTGGTQRLAISNSEVVFNDTGADVDFRVETDTSSHAIFVNAGNDRVAIGSSNPLGDFHVNLGTNKNIIYSGGIGEIGNVAGFQTATDDGSANTGFGIRASEMNFAIGSSTVLRLHTDGKVGIRTSSPQHDLDILKTGSGSDSSFRVASTAASGDNDATIIINNGGSGDASLRFDYESSASRCKIYTNSSTNDLIFDTDGNETMRLKADHKVGIGTTSPSGQLHVKNSSVSDTKIILESNGTNSYPAFRVTNDARSFDIGIDGGADSFRVFDVTANKQRITVDTTGRFSINGDGTKGMLEVRASGGADDQLTAVFGSNEGTTDGTLTNNADKACRIGVQHYQTAAKPFAFLVGVSGNTENSLGIGGGTSRMNAANLIRFYTTSGTTTVTGAERMSIGETGNVLIGNRADVSTSDRGRLAIDCQGRNAVANLADADKYGLVFLNDPTTDHGNGIGFFNDSGSTCGGAILHQDKGSGNLGDLVFYTSATSDNPVERMRINSSGTIDLGASGPSARINPTSNGELYLEADPNGNYGSSNIRFYIDNTEVGRMVAGTHKFFGVGRSSSQSNARMDVQSESSQDVLFVTQAQNADIRNMVLLHSYARSGQTASQMQFMDYQGVTRGKISNNNSSTTYATSSDYRLKENEVAISDGTERIKQLKPYKFNWKNRPNTIVDGFFAHEVQDIVEDCVIGKKDAVNENGDPDYQMMDHSKLVPLLVAAVKELIGRVETLEAA